MQIHQLDGYIESIYLVEYSSGLLLLDGCCRSDIAQIQHFIQHTLKRPISDLKLICVTHMHPDHAGAAHRLRRLSGAKIATLNKQGQWYSGIAGLSMFMVDNALALYVARRLGKKPTNLFYVPYLRADYYLSDGNVLPHFNDWQVLDTHGHTDRDMSLWHPISGQIYVADVLIKLKNKYVAPFPLYFLAHYHQSLQKIRALQPRTVIMAHGGMQHITSAEWDDILKSVPKRRRTVADTIRHKLLWWSKIKKPTAFKRK